MQSFKLPSVKVRLVATIIATLFATFFGAILAAPAGAAVTSASISPAAFTRSEAPVKPQTALNCNPDPFAEVSECTTVDHTGLKIRSIQGKTDNNTLFPVHNLHIEIFYAGKKNRLIHNCGPFSLGPLGTGPTCTWHNPHPSRKMKAGNYCSEVWQKESAHNYRVLSVECVDVTRSN